jgi:site-specific DNA recombinase
MTTAAAYIRVSSEMQVEVGASLPSQLEAVRSYAERNGYVIDDEHIYSDEGASARPADRPAFQRMIATARPKATHVRGKLSSAGRTAASPGRARTR